MNDNVPNVKAAAKEFLLEEYKAFSNSLEKNEQSGETRVNWFIGIIAAGVSGLVKILTDGKIQGWPPELTIVVGLAALLVFGVVTLFRIIKRNRRTDQLIQELDKIRKLFREHFDASPLAEHRPFGRTDDSQDGFDRERTFGGLADLVLTINSLLAAALVTTLLIRWLIAACLIAPIAFTLAFGVQRHLVRTQS